MIPVRRIVLGPLSSLCVSRGSSGIGDAFESVRGGQSQFGAVVVWFVEVRFKWDGCSKLKVCAHAARAD